jgi:hypothetical protein
MYIRKVVNFSNIHYGPNMDGQSATLRLHVISDSSDCVGPFTVVGLRSNRRTSSLLFLINILRKM